MGINHTDLIIRKLCVIFFLIIVHNKAFPAEIQRTTSYKGAAYKNSNCSVTKNIRRLRRQTIQKFGA